MEQTLEEFKRRMKIYHSSEDEALKDILQASFEDIRQLIGDFEMEQFPAGKELVFERGRYVYNGSLEYFHTNFQQRIMDLSLELEMERSADHAS